MFELFKDFLLSSKESGKDYLQRLENWTPGGRLTLGSLFVTVLVVVLGLSIGWAMIPAVLVTAAIIGFYWPKVVLATIMREPPWWTCWPLRIACFLALSAMLQHVQFFMIEFVIIIIGGVALGLGTWRWISPKIGKWILGWGLLTFVALIYVVPGFLYWAYGWKEFHVRALMRDENLGVYMVHTDYGATEQEEGESFRNEDMPLWQKYGSDDTQGLLQEAKDKGYLVRARVTYFRFKPLHLHCNLVKVKVVIPEK